MDYDHLRALGPLGLPSRFRRLAERLAAETRRVYRGAGVDFEPRWFPLFSLLLDAGGSTVGEAARALSVSHVAVSRLAGQMRDRGLIATAPDPEDGRATRLALTERGEQVLAEVEPLWDELARRWSPLIDAGGADVLATLDALDDRLSGGMGGT